MHQTLSKKESLRYVAGRQSGFLTTNDLQPTFNNSVSRDWVDEISAALEEVLRVWTSFDLSKLNSDQSRDSVEGSLAAVLHAGLHGLPAAILTDRDFWRYCAAFLYEFVVWRHPSSSLNALYPYFGLASDSLGVECVPHRMFDRAHIARLGGAVDGGTDVYALARFGAADVWKSHIIRTRNSYAPIVVHELLLDVQAGKLPTDPVRLLAKNLKRVRSNVLFEVLDQPQARDLIDRETSRATAVLATGLDSEVASG